MIKNRTVFIQKTIYYLTLFLFVLSTIAGWFGIDASTVNVRMKEYKPEQKITGWGTSAAWWAQMVSEKEAADEYAKLLYSEEGLGLNVYRYNVGGGEAENPECRIWDVSRRAESFLIPEVYAETGKLEYDFTKDANAQNMLFTSLDYGCIDTVVLFANSPHYLMTVSGHASGGLEVNQSNLKKECYEDFADYMLDIAEYFISQGVPVKYISPINEPQWSWGDPEWVGQEGCHYEIDEVIEVARVFARKIKERGIDVKLSMAESGQVGDHAMDCLDLLYADEEIASVMGTYAYHSYWTDDNFALKYAFGNYLKAKYPSVEVEMSEWCELPNAHKADEIDAALIMARTMCEDITLTGVNSWSSWVAVNGGGLGADSMLYVDGDWNDFEIGKRYYAMAHYAKFIPTGSRLIDTDISVADLEMKKEWWTQWIDDKEYPVYVAVKNDFYVSSYVTPEGDYVAVVVNEADEGRKVRFDKFWNSAAVYTTDAERNLELTGEIGRGFKNIEIGPKSITTVVFSK